MYSIIVEIQECSNMNYKLVYSKIISSYGAKKKPKGVYTERHHIIPKSVGGSDDPANLVYLPARVHFICHSLLRKIYPTSSKLKFAFWAMCNQKNCIAFRDYKVSSVMYQKAKEEFSVANSKLHKNKKLSKEHIETIRTFMLGREQPKGADSPLFNVPRSDAVKSKISKTKRSNPEKSNMFKGYFITPFGRFPTCGEAVENHPTIKNTTSILNFCKRGDMVVTKFMTYKGPFTIDDVGKSLRSLGWDFEPVSL